MIHDIKTQTHGEDDQVKSKAEIGVPLLQTKDCLEKARKDGPLEDWRERGPANISGLISNAKG